MITELIERYNELRVSSPEAAERLASDYIKSLNLQTPAERGAIWDMFKQQTRQEKDLAAKQKARELRKEKREAAAKRASIKDICKQALARGCIKDVLSENEKKFLNDIGTKRKLTERQKNWLLNIASRLRIEVKGEIQTRASRSAHFPASTKYCEHEDLGSFGYAHGTIVTCPNCGAAAEVW